MNAVTLVPMFCETCQKPHRRDLSGPRCHDCRMQHGLAKLAPITGLVRVEAPSPMMNARMAGIDQHMQEIA